MTRIVGYAQFGMVVAWLLAGCQNPEKALSDVAGRQKVASKELQAARKAAYEATLAQDFDAGIRLYEQARKLAQKEENQQLATQFLVNIAGCYQATSAYRDAMEKNRRAIEEARRHGLVSIEAVAVNNLAILLQEMGEVKSAGQVVQTFPLDGSKILPEVKLAAFMQQSSIFAQLEDEAQKRSAFERALMAADEAPSPEVIAANQKKYEQWPESIRELRRAWAFAEYSKVLTRQYKFAEAEVYALESFRLRAIYQDKARLRDCLQLEMLSRQRGDLDHATQLMEVARQLERERKVPMSQFLLEREWAQIEIARGNFSEAMPWLRRALATARGLRMAVLPSTSTFLSFEANLSQDVQREFLKTILRSNADLRDKSLAEESLWIAEEARFASMRAAQFPAAEFATRLPQDYWITLKKFQKLQDQLQMFELQAGLVLPASSQQVVPEIGKWMKTLPEDEVVFSYYLADPESLAWVITRKGIQVRKIAGRKELTRLVDRFREEIVGNSHLGTNRAGMELSRQLFGEKLRTERTTPYWTMVIDQELSTIPFSALPTGNDGEKYLVERHDLRVLPSVLFAGRLGAEKWAGRAEGLGDPVYNSADGRGGELRTSSTNWLQLGRLPESNKEIEQSLAVMRQRGWNVQARTGLEANREELELALKRSPDILHVSAHFLNTNNEGRLSIALSPKKGNDSNSLLNMLDLNALRTRTKLVVLSGCSSSTGELVPSIGINGLSRAFLISGARDVLATLWPVTDSSGPLFPVFYAELMKNDWNSRSAARALRESQLAMIRQGGWTANPAYWAAYIAISKG